MTTFTTAQKVDLVNIGLVLLSFVLAYSLPFQLFLVVYAVLGPLHYLTEMNWIRDKAYFTSFKYWLPLSISLALLIVLPKIFLLQPLVDWMDPYIARSHMLTLNNMGNIFLFVALCTAICSQLFDRTLYIWLGALLSFGLAFIIHQNYTFTVWVGLFLPTLIHVYLFTLLFMLYGAKKSKSKFGLANAFLMLCIPVLIAFIPLDIIAYNFSSSIKEAFVENRFHITNVSLSKLLGLSDGTTFFFYEDVELRIQIFVAFAYLYHYLNWFSKTSVIKWHKGIHFQKFILIMVVWILCVLVFYIDYRWGVAFSLLLSFAHVILEFPINIISVKGLFR